MSKIWFWSDKFCCDLAKFSIGNIEGKFVLRMVERQPRPRSSCRPHPGHTRASGGDGGKGTNVEGGRRSSVGRGGVLTSVGGGWTLQGRAVSQPQHRKYFNNKHHLLHHLQDLHLNHLNNLHHYVLLTPPQPPHHDQLSLINNYPPHPPYVLRRFASLS